MNGPWVDAICRVDAAGRGTGFVVGSTDGPRILTARHVVAGSPIITVTFKSGFTTRAKVELTGTDDWVALACIVAIPETIPHIELDDLDEIDTKRFFTYGHANLYGAMGGPFHGEIRPVPAGWWPWAHELQGEATDKAKGLSGAPCVVADVACGLITDVIGGKNAAGGSLSMVPARAIVEQSGTKLQLVSAGRLPYHEQIAAILEHLGRESLTTAANRLGLKVVADLELSQLRARVGRMLSIAPLDRIVSVVSALQSTLGNRAKELLVLCESLWIPPAMARQVAKLVASGGRAAVLNATTEVVASDLLRQSCWHANVFEERWHLRSRCLVVHAVEHATADQVVEEIVTVAQSPPMKEVDRESLAALCRDYAPIFAIVCGVLPRSEILAAIQKDLPDLHVIFFTGSLATDESVPRLLPELSSQQERMCRNGRDRARKLLQLQAQIAVNDNDLWNVPP